MTDDPRSPDYTYEQLISEADQASANGRILAGVMASEWKALVDDGVGRFSAAVIIGTRWNVGNT